MISVDYIILGGGPTALALSNKLMASGINSFVVLEKESEPGGLCRSQMVDGSMLDIGGGHFLDVRNKTVLDFVFSFLPENEWNRYDRVSKINISQQEIDYPIEANIWQFDIEQQIEYLISMAKAGCNNNQTIPDKFSDWIVWKLGSKIADDYMLPYNKKLFSCDLDSLGTYWLYKLPNASFEETLRSCLMRKMHANLPAHGKFFYPQKYGYGEVFLRMGKALGDKLICNFDVNTVDFNNLIVNDAFKANKSIITTIPWCDIRNNETIPENIIKDISELRFSAINIDYHEENIATDSHWTYFPDENLSFHRILYRHNFLENSKGYWTETNSSRQNEQINFRYHNKFAYPHNTINKPQQIKNILEWAKTKNVIGIGRWGQWEHMNSDVAIMTGLDKAGEILCINR